MCVKEKQVHLECAVHFMVSLSFLGMNLKTFKSKWIWIINCYELQTCLFNLNNTLFKILIFRQSGHLNVSKCKDYTCINVKSQDRDLADFKYCSKNNSDSCEFYEITKNMGIPEFISKLPNHLISSYELCTCISKFKWKEYIIASALFWAVHVHVYNSSSSSAMIVLLHPACFLLPKEFHTCLNEASMGAVAIIQTAQGTLKNFHTH